MTTLDFPSEVSRPKSSRTIRKNCWSKFATCECKVTLCFTSVKNCFKSPFSCFFWKNRCISEVLIFGCNLEISLCRAAPTPFLLLMVFEQRNLICIFMLLAALHNQGADLSWRNQHMSKEKRSLNDYGSHENDFAANSSCGKSRWFKRWQCFCSESLGFVPSHTFHRINSSIRTDTDTVFHPQLCGRLIRRVS